MSTPSSDGDRALPRKRGRSVPAVYGIVSLVLVVGAVTFALSTPPPSTPPLAAVAPAPQEQLEVERVEQSSRFGEGTGGEGDCVPGDAGCGGVGEAPAPPPPGPQEQPSPAEQPSPDVTEVADHGTLRNCPNGPGGPRQTDDPQSPPCMREIFSGDNGGATATGVTATTVRIAVPRGTMTGSGSREQTEQAFFAAITRHFNDEYEFHGRQLELVFVDPAGKRGSPAEERTFAREIASHEVFASLDMRSPTSTYQRALTELGVIVTLGNESFERADGQPARRFGDLGWSVFPDHAEAFAAGADLVCTALTDRPAQHGGDQVRDRTRSFGVLVESRDGIRVDPSVLVSRLEACSAPFATYDADVDDAESVTLALQRMRDAGVTTVVCACRALGPDHTVPADELGWEPEWFLPGTDDHAVSNGYIQGQTDKGLPPAQLRHAFAVTPRMKRPDVAPPGSRQAHEQQFWYQAARDSDPSFSIPNGTYFSREFYGWYAELLLLASGIQWAGPDLTPESFADALEGLTYPNPWVGEAPWFQPRVTVGPSDHALNSDFALLWFEVDELDNDDARAGRSCYVGGGTRFTVGGFPADADDMFFDPEAGCR